MLTHLPDFDAIQSLLKRPYPRTSWTPRAIARRLKLSRERDARREMMRMLANSKQRHGRLLA
jgi:hypothetical protein